jgi:hypothetical protein
MVYFHGSTYAANIQGVRACGIECAYGPVSFPPCGVGMMHSYLVDNEAMSQSYGLRLRLLQALHATGESDGWRSRMVFHRSPRHGGA